MGTARSRKKTSASTATSLISLSPAIRQRIRILVIDDDQALRDRYAGLLGAQGYHVTLSGDGAEALEMLKRRAFDIVLIDLAIESASGVELLRTALATHRETVVIVTTDEASAEASVGTLRAGAWDYLLKPFSAKQLKIVIGRAAHSVTVAREGRAQDAESGSGGEPVTVLGTAPLFRQAISLARKVAATDASVFITGESGSGKELFAQFIHAHSRRQARPIVAVNCATLPEPHLESEMFGHMKGAFTGATCDKAGLLEMANGGTLFLDDLVDMPPAMQAKLLRVIQDGVVRRVGIGDRADGADPHGGSEPRDAVVNVRFITATNRDPEEAVRAGALHKDLYYRLRVVPIHIPPLRDRPQDIPLLANYFRERFWRAHRGTDLPAPKLTKAALAALRAYAWPGNVRELQNVIEHAAVLLEPGADIRPEDIPFIDDNPSTPDPEGAADSAIWGDGYYAARKRLLSAFDRQFLMKVLVSAGGNLSKAARMAHVDRATFYRLMERYGLHRDSLLVSTA